MNIWIQYMLLNLPIPLHQPTADEIKDWPVQMVVRDMLDSSENPNGYKTIRTFEWSQNQLVTTSRAYSSSRASKDSVIYFEETTRKTTGYTSGCPTADDEVITYLRNGVKSNEPDYWNNRLTCRNGRPDYYSRVFQRYSATNSNSDFHFASKLPVSQYQNEILDSIAIRFPIERHKKTFIYNPAGQISKIISQGWSTGIPRDTTADYYWTETFTYFGSDSIQTEGIDSSSNGKRLRLKSSLVFSRNRLKSKSLVFGYDISTGSGKWLHYSFIYPDETPMGIFRPQDDGDKSQRAKRYPVFGIGNPYGQWLLGRRPAPHFY